MLGVLVAAAVAVVAMKPSLLPGDPFGTGDPGQAAASPLPAETAAPTAPPSSADARQPRPAHPFAGSPAERWADGAAGIVLPKATAVGSLSKAQVEQALQQTRTLLTDANLNAATLRGERPTTALGVIEPRQKDLLTRLNTSLRKPVRVLDIEMSDWAEYRVTPGKIAVIRYDQKIGNSACDVYDGYLHPRFDADGPTGAPPTGPTTDPYDRSKGIDDDRTKACGTVSRV